MRRLDCPTGSKGFLDALGVSAVERFRRLVAYRTLIKYLVLKENDILAVIG